MATKKVMTRVDGGVTHVRRRPASGSEAAAVLVHENYVIEGNCRVACIRG